MFPGISVAGAAQQSVEVSEKLGRSFFSVCSMSLMQIQEEIRYKWQVGKQDTEARIQ
jgi:hypothetical protein